jgi:hypothetical protein
MRVFDGVVSTTGARGEVAFDDTEHVEAWLLDSARRQGYGAILDDLGPSEGRPRGEVSPGPDGHGRD